MRDSSQPIGIFDSGIGGLTVVRQVQQLMPAENIVYLGDTARVPYGTKGTETVNRFACEDAAFLHTQNVKAIVVACNSASASALPVLNERFSQPTFGVIVPGAIAAVNATRNGRIGVIGTQATLRSRAYDRAIHELGENIEVHGQACPLLVPLVEEGWVDHDVTAAVLREYLEPLLARKIDTLVLGCTHYPLLKAAIAHVTGPDIALVDSAESCAQYVQRELERLGLLASEGRGGMVLNVTDEMERVTDLAERFLGQRPEKVAQVELSSL
jgi:glutamate racemase